MSPFESAAVIRCFLAFILLLSGAGKVLSPQATREAVTGYGVPRRLSGAVSRLVPVVEIALATGLIFQAVPLVFSTGAALLLSAFLAGVVRARMRGEDMDCHCFGALTQEPITSVTLIRSAALVVLALILVGGDAWLMAAHGFSLVDSRLSSATSLLPIAALSSTAAVSLLLAGQIFATVRAIREVSLR